MPTPSPATPPIAGMQTPGSDFGFTRPNGNSGQGVSIVLHATEKWGKTTFGAYAPDVAILCAPRETGYVTLYDANLVPSVDFLVLKDWLQLQKICEGICSANPPKYKNLVFDALGGFERLCHQYVCDREYKGDWGSRGFTSYMQGYSISIQDWLLWLSILDRIKNKGINIILLAHSLVKNFKNPLGADFDRYIVDTHEKTWGATHKWADVILFGNFMTAVELEERDKSSALAHGKGIGGARRIVYTQRRDAYDAGNRFGLPETIDIPNQPEKTWTTIFEQIERRRNHGTDA